MLITDKKIKLMPQTVLFQNSKTKENVDNFNIPTTMLVTINY